MQQTVPEIRLRARTLLSDLVNKARSGQSGRLPTVKALAAAAGVSHGIMGEVVREFVTAGVLLSHRSRGTVVRTEGVPAHCAVAHLPLSRRWEQIRMAISEEAVAGRYGFGGPLPSPKELMKRFGASFRTVRRALKSLVDAGTIEPFRRTYRVACASAPTSRRSRIILFTCGTQTGRLYDFNGRTHDYFHALEQECLSRNLSLQVIPCYHTPSGMQFDGENSGLVDGIVRGNDVAGFMVWQTDLPDDFVRRVVLQLEEFGRPISLFNDLRDAVVADTRSPGRHIRNVAFQDNYLAGRQVARHLIQRGHRRVTCFTAAKDHGWSQDRIRGIRDAYAEASHGDAVRECALELRGLSFSEGDLPPWARHVASLASSNTTAIERDLGVSVQAATSVEIRNRLIDITFQELLGREFAQAFRANTADPAITAWVGINDLYAVACLLYLREHRIAVPQAVSVVGFDNSIEARFQRLTSYCFNEASAMHLMVEFILRPHTPLLPGDPRKPVEVNGFVHERGTTARA